MKIYWPWHGKKLLSLFEKRVPWRDEGPTDRPPILPCETPYRGPHPLNAPGPFFVENQECIACGYPHVLAPDLMEWEKDVEGRESHCYFKKQPETEYELEQAINAIQGSCCGALQYSGNDPKIRKRLHKR